MGGVPCETRLRATRSEPGGDVTHLTHVLVMSYDVLRGFFLFTYCIVLPTILCFVLLIFRSPSSVSYYITICSKLGFCTHGGVLNKATFSLIMTVLSS